MRTERISYTVNGVERSGTVKYPDLWCFAFNPNYIEIDLNDESANNVLAVSLQSDSGSYTLNASLFHGKASVYISKTLQLLIGSPEKIRSATVYISLTDTDVKMLASDLTLNAVWGSVKIGEQFGKYGAFKWNGKDLSHIRNVVWFRNFPFYVSMFRAESGELTSAKFDGNEADANAQIFRYRIDKVVTGKLPTFPVYSRVLTNPFIVLNKEHGVIYALEDSLSTTAYDSWASNSGGRWDYVKVDGTIRTDTEFAYNEEIVRWNNDTKELETSLIGNAKTDGIFDLNPAISFPNAKRTAQYNICLEKVTSGIFDMNFNFAFPDMAKIVNETVNMRICNDKDGLYIRWIDRFGFLQFYLFREGKATVKTKPSSDTLQVEREFGGMYFGGMERAAEITSEETIKCCAVNLPKDILEYVKTIVNAPIVDLYLGKNKGGTELWLPISVSSGSYSTDPKTMLSDYEITIEKTDNSSQTL